MIDLKPEPKNDPTRAINAWPNPKQHAILSDLTNDRLFISEPSTIETENVSKLSPNAMSIDVNMKESSIAKLIGTYTQIFCNPFPIYT